MGPGSVWHGLARSVGVRQSRSVLPRCDVASYVEMRGCGRLGMMRRRKLSRVAAMLGSRGKGGWARQALVSSVGL